MRLDDDALATTVVCLPLEVTTHPPFVGARSTLTARLMGLFLTSAIVKSPSGLPLSLPPHAAFHFNIVHAGPPG